MNANGSSVTSPTGPRNVEASRECGSASSRSPTHTDLGQSSSVGSSRSDSSFSSRKLQRSQQNQQQQFNESTPIFNGAGASTRNYLATEAPAPPHGLIGQQKNNQTNSPAPSNGTTRADGNAQVQQSNQPQEPAEPRQAWYKRVLAKYGSLELENKGSVARDHLALERTFLAWMRTSLAFASIGIAVTQLFRLNTPTAATDSNNTPPAILPPTVSHTLLDLAIPNSPTESSRLRSVGKPLGSTFIGVAILILIVGFHRYFESQYWIVRGKFPASRGSVALTAFAAAALIIAALAVILAVSPSAVER